VPLIPIRELFPKGFGDHIKDLELSYFIKRRGNLEVMFPGKASSFRKLFTHIRPEFSHHSIEVFRSGGRRNFAHPEATNRKLYGMLANNHNYLLQRARTRDGAADMVLLLTTTGAEDTSHVGERPRLKSDFPPNIDPPQAFP
jgi:hypothetical protein